MNGRIGLRNDGFKETRLLSRARYATAEWRNQLWTDRGGGVGGSTAARTASLPTASAQRAAANKGNGSAVVQIAAAGVLAEQQCAGAELPWHLQS
ncbi:MAG: hypothetical protein JNL06_12485 [Alphaproteobacteria bacterium]|nr:hypothetical protein [Alphaproteobacteria bacterium]